MANASPSAAPNTTGRRRGLWLRTMVQWHWVSSAVCLAGMLLFSITGITLNHAREIETTPAVVNNTAQLPRGLLDALNKFDGPESDPLPAEVATWLGREFSRPIGARPAEWSDDEVYVSMPSPGVDAWLAVDRTSGRAEFESTDRGWVAYFNDLHKARHTGAAWKWFLDLFAAASVVFCLTGLYLLYFHARHRRMTWPVVALGVAIPVLIAVWMSHAP